ncbi:MAG: hypothetical protein CR974_03795 [Gammaproteobacteria bacterium]|nr:MAG: hypothetical protein CR974_03795 [Gammaproteobacteria bacterium]
MRDYADYFIDKKPSEKRGVSIHHDIDWWMEKIATHMAKFLFVILLILLAFFCHSLMNMGKDERFFPLNEVTVSGDILLTTPKDVNEALTGISDKSFLVLDVNDVATRLQQLPWVESATVTRHWPNSLSIALTERKAAYRWGDCELIDVDGTRFAKTHDSLFSTLPKLSGVDGFEGDVINAYQHLVSQLGVDAEYLDIDQFVLNKYLSWELHLKSGVIIKFGRDNYSERVTRFAEAFKANKLPNLDKLNVLDFRYNRGFAVKWKPEFRPQSQNGKMVRVSTGI